MRDAIKRSLLNLCTTWAKSGRPGEMRTVLHHAVRLMDGREDMATFHVHLDSFFAHLDRDDLCNRAGYGAIRRALLLPGGSRHTLRRLGGDPLLSLAVRLSYHQQIGFDFMVLRRGEQIPPHGHRRAVSGFCLIEGQVAVRHYHPVAEQKGQPLLRLTVDKVLGPGDAATESELRDNIHWLCGLCPASILFRVNVKNVPTGDPQAGPGHTRLYVDPRGEAGQEGGLGDLILGRWTDEATARAIPPFRS